MDHTNTPANDDNRPGGSTAALDYSKSPVRCRALTLADVMIVLVGVALSLAAGLHLFPLLADMLVRLGHNAAASMTNMPGNWAFLWRAVRFEFINTINYTTQIIVVVLASMTPVFLILRIRHPRPNLRTLLCQPGVVAALAMVFGLFWVTGALLTVFPNRFNSLTAAPVAVGGTVAVCWSLLALTRRWKIEPGWIDGLGRTLGCAAIAIAGLVPLTFRL